MTTAELYEKLNRGFLTWVDFGWKKGLTGWQRLCDLEELKSLMPSRPAQEIQRKVQKSVEAQASSPIVTSSPISAASAESKIWYLYSNSSQYGPFAQTEILRAIEIGKINSRVHAWSHGMSGWERLERIPVFQAQGVVSSPAKSPRKQDSKVASSSSRSGGGSRSADPSEKREDPRRPMVAQILMSDEQTVIVGICRDISIGGLQVLTDRAPAPVGSKLKMNISPSGDGSGKGFQPFVAEGVVVRVLEDGRGFSFRFSKLSDAARRSVEDYIESSE